MLRAMLICILGLALVGPGAGRVALAQDKPLTEVTLTLDFIVLGRHAPWYVALAKGFVGRGRTPGDRSGQRRGCRAGGET